MIPDTAFLKDRKYKPAKMKSVVWTAFKNKEKLNLEIEFQPIFSAEHFISHILIRSTINKAKDNCVVIGYFFHPEVWVFIILTLLEVYFLEFH